MTPKVKNNDKEKVERRKKWKNSAEFSEKLDKNEVKSKGVTKKNYYIRSQSKKTLDKLEAAIGGVIYKKALLKNLQNLLENTCVRAYFLIKLQACEI